LALAAPVKVAVGAIVPEEDATPEVVYEMVVKGWL
jgi:hypothetical protein